MRKFVFIILLIIPYSATQAQFVSLSTLEIKTLKAKISNDPQTMKIYAGFQKSVAVYLNELPNPIDTIRTEGLLKGNPKKEKTKLALADMNKMFALALQYRLTNDQNYLKKCISFLSAWAKTNQPNGDPIDDTNLDKAIDAYDLIKADIPDAEKRIITEWLSKTALAEINSARMKSGKATAINNWNAHRLKVVGEIGYATNNQEFTKWTIGQLKKHISVNLYADGTSLDFKQRDALHYHVYDLAPLLKLAIIINRVEGINFYTYQSPQGSSVRKSVEWLIPYVKGEKQHEEYAHTTVKFDRDRAKNNEPGFASGTLFEPKLALPVLELSVYFEPDHQNLLIKLMDDKRNMDQVINEIKQIKIK